MEPLNSIGFIGLGNMGRPMAARLQQAGFTLTVYDSDPQAQQTFLEDHGGKGAASTGQLAAGSDAVITMLPDGDVVRRVVLGNGQESQDQLLGSMPRGSILIDMSSSSPTGSQDLGRILSQHEIQLLDAPVSGGVPKAVDGTLAIIVGGEVEVVERCRPLFEAMGSQIYQAGKLGAGHALKALNNLVSAAGLIAAAEALLIGRRFGLDPSVMIDVLNASTGRNNSTENKFKRFILSRRFDSGFSLDLMVKDLTTAVKLAHEAGTPAVFSGVCRELWAAAQAALETDSDHTDVVRWLEEMAKTELR